MSYRQAAFLKDFDKADFARFRTTFESISPDRPIQTADVKFEGADLWLRNFLEAFDDSKRSFLDEMLPNLGLFLHCLFPLPGMGVTRKRLGCPAIELPKGRYPTSVVLK